VGSFHLLLQVALCYRVAHLQHHHILVEGSILAAHAEHLQQLQLTML
jgi:hypothetical protein